MCEPQLELAVLEVEDYEEFLGGDKCLSLELDEVVQLLIVLIGNYIDEFGSCFKDKIGGGGVERVSMLGFVSNAKTN